MYVDRCMPTYICIYVGMHHKIFSFWPNCSGGVVLMHYTGYYTDHSYSAIYVNGNGNRFVPLTDKIYFC